MDAGAGYEINVLQICSTKSTKAKTPKAKAQSKAYNPFDEPELPNPISVDELMARRPGKGAENPFETEATDPSTPNEHEPKLDLPQLQTGWLVGQASCFYPMLLMTVLMVGIQQPFDASVESQLQSCCSSASCSSKCLAMAPTCVLCTSLRLSCHLVQQHSAGPASEGAIAAWQLAACHNHCWQLVHMVCCHSGMEEHQLKELAYTMFFGACGKRSNAEHVQVMRAQLEVRLSCCSLSGGK